ncbi:MAG TPA: ABC transporter transmembrane domain-containing protein, partial [Desulfuromonadales bacterium]|nr:ABC transporter transmembrane domain-containing protein [Desulfuromonadales bacterium]
MSKEKSSTLYRRLLRYVKPYRMRVGVSMVASLGVAAANGATAKLVEPFINRIVVAGDPTLVKYVPMAVIALAVLLGASRYVQEYFIRTAGQLVMQSIRNDLYEHSIRLSMRFYARNPAGTLMSRVLNDVGVMQSSVADVLVGILREGATFLGLVAVAFYTDWKLAAMAFVVMPVAGGPAAWIGRR